MVKEQLKQWHRDFDFDIQPNGLIDILYLKTNKSVTLQSDLNGDDLLNYINSVLISLKEEKVFE